MKSDLFIECANSVVDFYNLTQESIGSKNRMEYPVVVKPREWWVITSSRSGTMACDDYKKACDLADELLGNQNTEIIKVREVIG